MRRAQRTWVINLALPLTLLWLVASATPAYAWTRPMLDASEYHTVGLKAGGSPIGVGHTLYGDSYSWTFSSEWTGITAIAAGDRHTVGLKSDGTVVTAGWDSNGEVNGPTNGKNGFTNITAIAAGPASTFGIKSDKTVAAVGYGNYDSVSGVLNGANGFTDIVALAPSCGNVGGHTVGLKSDGTVVAVGWTAKGQTNVTAANGFSNIVAIAAGYQHTVGLKSDGTVVAVGDNTFGQCNVTTANGFSNIVAIAAGYNHTVGLKSDGTVVAVGTNANGQTNVTIAKGFSDIVAIAAGYTQTVGLQRDGDVVAVGRNQLNELPSGWNLADDYAKTLPASGISLDFGKQAVDPQPSATAATGEAPPSGLRIMPGTCWNISTTTSFTGNVDVTIPYDEADLQGASEAELELYHYASPGGWERITASVDTVNNTVTGTTSSFSDFAVMGPAPAPAEPVVSTPASSLWSLVMLGVAGLGLAVASRQRFASTRQG